MMETDRMLSEFVKLVDGYRRMEKKCSELDASSVDADKFYGWAVDVNTLSAMHGVSKHLVRRYIELGLIETHPNSTDSKFLVRGSTALRLDFGKLKEEAKFIRYRKK